MDHQSDPLKVKTRWIIQTEQEQNGPNPNCTNSNSAQNSTKMTPLASAEKTTTGTMQMDDDSQPSQLAILHSESPGQNPTLSTNIIKNKQMTQLDNATTKTNENHQNGYSQHYPALNNNSNHNNNIKNTDNKDLPLTIPLAAATPVTTPSQDKMPQYEEIEENIYLIERKDKKGKKHKELRRMVCDCILSKDERAKGKRGCSDDCLNRMLMIECGSRCTLGELCLNKRFQRREYALVEAFKTHKKGWGLRTLTDLPQNAFIMEYVGEVVGSREFKHRVKRYSKLKIKHHYFMALRNKEIIDATGKGNRTRFINHSCDPNCETQKWTVNGELRIGFFSKRALKAGEEITFDYQFQRYGKKAQKCYCGAEKCRGYIGGEENSSTSISFHSKKSSSKRKGEKKSSKHINSSNDDDQDQSKTARRRKRSETGNGEHKENHNNKSKDKKKRKNLDDADLATRHHSDDGSELISGSDDGSSESHHSGSQSEFESDSGSVSASKNSSTPGRRRSVITGGRLNDLNENPDQNPSDFNHLNDEYQSLNGSLKVFKIPRVERNSSSSSSQLENDKTAASQNENDNGKMIVSNGTNNSNHQQNQISNSTRSKNNMPQSYHKAKPIETLGHGRDSYPIKRHHNQLMNNRSDQPANGAPVSSNVSIGSSPSAPKISKEERRKMFEWQVYMGEYKKWWDKYGMLIQYNHLQQQQQQPSDSLSGVQIPPQMPGHPSQLQIQASQSQSHASLAQTHSPLNTGQSPLVQNQLNLSQSQGHSLGQIHGQSSSSHHASFNHSSQIQHLSQGPRTPESNNTPPPSIPMYDDYQHHQHNTLKHSLDISLASTSEQNATALHHDFFMAHDNSEKQLLEFERHLYMEQHKYEQQRLNILNTKEHQEQLAISTNLQIVANQDYLAMDNEIAASQCDYDVEQDVQRQRLNEQIVLDPEFPCAGSYYTTPDGETWFASLLYNRHTHKVNAVTLYTRHHKLDNAPTIT